MKFDSLSVFFPAYNDSKALPDLIGKTFSVLKRSVRDYEVIVVNDGSEDNTAQVLQDLRQIHGPKLRIITHEHNKGYGGALRSGFQAATREFVFYTDGDGQYDVNELPELLKKANSAVGLVNGFKLERQDPWHRIWIGKMYNAFARSLFRIHIRDIDCDFRLIRRDLLKDLSLESTSGTICVELVRGLELSGCGIREVGVHHFARQHGKSQFFRLRSLLNTFVQLGKLYSRLVVKPAFSGTQQQIVRKAYKSAA